MYTPPPADFPVFDSSDFSGEAGAFHFDLVRLEDRPDIPRGFPHRHNYYHLLWMSEAAGTHLLDFETFEARANTVFFVSPGQLHAWASTVQPKGFVINFSTEFFVQMFPRSDDIAKYPFFHIASDPPVLYLAQAQHDELLPLLLEMESEMLGRAEARLDIVRSYLLVLLTRLRRLYPARAADGASPQSYSLAKRFKLLIDQHYLDFGPLRDYAQRLHVTERQLNDAVKRTLGKTAGELVHERLVLEAKRLLCNTDMGVAEIAFHLHFEDHAYFSRFFKKRTQLTPGEFKKRYGTPR
ncbi:helix-turn-helix domain-containing protein [Variovorax beijingensis]|uniref:Helix-turn-helix domain-containing protein n=1 Tax=Variovorax beijingensis TaxID=2496117 RepID=A0A3P3E0I4_9BURK|nr:helix-turn-helix domain-containing protein [Variovorax beijingensis]RRH79881.1 helix-turn-helix domain-containing protein [Variovorax beijingensis]RSZ32081.1 helix-turn-helix domain-containing protein [Variovorax beijingensis]